MVTRVERIFLTLLIILGLSAAGSSNTYAGAHLSIGGKEGQRAVWSFYKNMRDIQAIQKKAPQSLKQIYDPMIDLTKREIRRVCKSSQYIYTGNESSICDKSRAGVVCRDVGGKIFSKESTLSFAIREVKFAGQLNINNFKKGLTADASTTAAKRREKKDG